MPTYRETLITRLKQTSATIERFSIIGELLEDGMNSASIARHSGQPDYSIRHHSRMHKKLVKPVKDLFLSGRLTFSMARALAGMPEKEQENAARKAIAKHISVQKFRSSMNLNDDTQLLRELDRLADQLSIQSGLDIKILADKNNVHAGNWMIRYTDLTMFETISEKITGKRSLDDF